MSDDVQTTPNMSDLVKQLANLLPRKQDWLLADLVKMANNIDLEFGITLTVSSGLVSGTLISNRKFHRELIEIIEAANPRSDDSMSSLHLVSDYLQDTISLYKELNEDENMFDHPVNFINLRNAKVYLGGHTVIPSQNGTLWRGRLSEISGFIIGSMKPEKENSQDT